MDYDKKLIEKAKASNCKICFEHITEPEADNMEFQATKTSRGGVLLCTYPVFKKGV
jgi:hypothetical protein